MAHNTLLLIEDNPGDIELIRYYFKDTAYEIVVTESLKEIEIILRSNEVGCIISDLNIGESRGLKTLDKLLSLSGEIPVIVLTGIIDPQVEKEALNSGAFEYMSKNALDTLQLLRAVKSVIHTSHIESQVNNLNKDIHTYKETTSTQVREGQLNHILSSLSHEFNTPLGIVKTLNSYILDEVEKIRSGDDHELALQNIENSVQLSTESINKLIQSLELFNQMQCFYTESKLEEISLEALGNRIKDHILTIHQIDLEQLQFQPTTNQSFVTYPECICEALALLSKSIIDKHVKSNILICIAINNIKELEITFELSAFFHELSNYAKYYKVDELPTIKHINPIEIGLYIINTLLQYKFNGRLIVENEYSKSVVKFIIPEWISN